MTLKNKFFVLLLFSFVFFSPLTTHAGVVPCGLNEDDLSLDGDQTAPCTICHLIVGTLNIFNWLKNILIIATVTAFMIGGIMYIVSTGSEQAITTAKNLIKSSLIGFAIVLMAWLCVNVTMWLVSVKDANNPDGYLGINKTGWNSFECSTKSSTFEGAIPSGETTTTEISSGNLSQAEAKTKLDAAGITVSSTGGCTDPNNPRCTSLQNIPARAIDNIINVKTICGITPTVTGGTETGHKSHGASKPVVDFSWNEQLAACLKHNTSGLNIVKICTMAQDSAYRINCSYNEPNRHIHVAFN